MKRFSFLFISLNIILAGILLALALAQPDAEQKYMPNRKLSEIDTAVVSGNRQCLECHANRKFVMSKPNRPRKKYPMKMPTDYIVDSVRFECSSHWNFSCVDCHSVEYKTAPHNQMLRFESISTCNDCHGGGDTAWTKFGFDTIAVEFEKSVHKDARANCYSCHNSHYTEVCARNESMPINQVIETSNAMCIRCHSLQNDTMIIAHEVFPHTDLHLKKSRCIDCHASRHDSIFVPHNVRPKEESIHECSQCHSQNSAIMNNFHQYRSESAEKQSNIAGFFRNNWLTVSIVAIVLFAILLGLGHLVWISIREKL